MLKKIKKFFKRLSEWFLDIDYCEYCGREAVYKTQDGSYLCNHCMFYDHC